MCLCVCVCVFACVRACLRENVTSRTHCGQTKVNIFPIKCKTSRQGHSADRRIIQRRMLLTVDFICKPMEYTNKIDHGKQIVIMNFKVKGKLFFFAMH